MQWCIMCRNKISCHLIYHVMCQISSASLPERHICVPKQSYRFQWQFHFRRVGLAASWIVGELVCRRVGLSASCPFTGYKVLESHFCLGHFCICPSLFPGERSKGVLHWSTRTGMLFWLERLKDRNIHMFLFPFRLYGYRPLINPRP